MGRREEPRMDELKKLLRRLDGLDGDKGLGQTAQEIDQRGYVGALRGAPVAGAADEHREIALPPPRAREAKPSGAGVYMAAATAALISTVTVFLLMSWQGKVGTWTPERTGQKRLELNQPTSGANRQESTETAVGLVRRADQLLRSGEIEAARVILQRAAELGSGTAAFKLGLSYDPVQTRSLNFADSQTNSALAKAWYERALALGTQEAAAYLSNPRGK